MQKHQLIRATAAATGASIKQTEIILNAALQQIKHQLVQGQQVNIVNFGVFSTSHIDERKGAHPNTQQMMLIPAHTRAKFRATGSLKTALNLAEKAA